MIKAINCTALSAALEKLKKIISFNEENAVKTVIFCEDRLSLAAERTVCAAVGGTFLTSVYTFARFLSSERGKSENILSSQGSAMAIRKIIENNSKKLALFKNLSSQNAAQSVYDTIALLYSSRISPEDAEAAATGGGMLAGKLKDLALIYSVYVNYLKENGLEDRNGYLKQLNEVIECSPKIKGNCVIFLGFQAFTCTTTECARSAFSVAADVYGLFIGGKEDLYVNEAAVSFVNAAQDFGGAEISSEGELPNAEAEILRQRIFNPESFYVPPVKSSRVHVYEAADCEEEMQFIAAAIKRHVFDAGERYAKISVMLSDLKASEKLLARTFTEYGIPYYVDRRRSLSEHPLCAFVCDFLNCICSGCRPEDVDGVISSPFFPVERSDKDAYRNYALRLACYRGGIKRVPDKTITENLGFDYDAVERARSLFLRGLGLLSAGKETGFCNAVRNLLEEYKVSEKLASLAETYRDEYPAEAEFSRRAYDGVLTVLAEAESLVGGLSLKDFIKILKSGFAAMEISLIPPKADAVFVGDISVTANTGSNVVFAAGLCGDVPDAGSDTALLTDREITILEGANLNISPKIRQVHARRRELVALNICAFRKHLYLTYPARLNGEESGASEIISYASAIFCTESGSALAPVELKKLEKGARSYPLYGGEIYCSEKIPAIKHMLKSGTPPALVSAIYEVLKRNGYADEADRALKNPVHPHISCGEQLYLTYNSVSPTALETYFSCPFLGFMRQGLKVQEREEGVVRPVDTGNFIHAVLQDLAKEINGIDSEDKLCMRAAEIAKEKLTVSPYSSLADSAGGKFTAGILTDEAVKVSRGMYEQLKNSKFIVAVTEGGCEVRLTPKIKIYGRIDRMDTSDDMVRIIDYKTGAVDASPSKYYTGEKLQLPLYLIAVSQGKRAVGAYYFPAAVEYRDKADGVFRLQGFMDGSDEVVSASDVTVQPSKKSEYFDAYLGGRKLDGAMTKEDFADFLSYSVLVAGKGAEEMISGNITPSPTGEACKYCKMGGSCGFSAGKDGEPRETGSVKCSEIAEIARRAKESGND